MANGSNGTTPTSLADSAARLYPDGNPNQAPGATGPGSANTRPASPYVVTNMTDGKTIYVDPNTGKSFEMETRNDIMPNSKHDADGPYDGKITGAEIDKTK